MPTLPNNRRSKPEHSKADHPNFWELPSARNSPWLYYRPNFEPLELPPTAPVAPTAPPRRRSSILWGALATLFSIAGLYWLALRQETPSLVVEPPATTAPIAPSDEAIVPESTLRDLAVPTGLEAVPLAPGVITYRTNQEVPTVNAASPGGTIGLTGSELDGTRYPYISEVMLSELLANPVAPGYYTWQTVWEGEGYGRRLEENQGLVADREGGADILVTLSYDATITDSSQPNFRLEIVSQQDESDQLTNLSAFWVAPNQTIVSDRLDFEQLPPAYTITLGRGRLPLETLSLEPLGQTQWVAHIAPDDLAAQFPLYLQADNRFFNQRLEQIADLEANGWEIREVPAPTGAL